MGRWASGMVTCFDAIHLDVVPGERLIYVHEMRLDEVTISASLAPLTFAAEGAGTRVTITEQGVFLDGYVDAGAREAATRDLLDQAAASLPA